MSSPTFRPTPAAGSGTGDMTKAVYDTDDDGKVDSAKTLDGFDSADFASRTASDLTLYVYEDATGTGDGSSKANGFTTLQAAIDAIPDVAQNVTIIVCKGSTNYLGQTTTIQKASVKSLTIQGEFYAYEACDANAVAGKVVDADADFSDFEVGDRVVCTKYSGTVGASSIDDYFYATITEVGEGYVQTSEETKIPTTGWKYLINQTVFDGTVTSRVINLDNNILCKVFGVTFENSTSFSFLKSGIASNLSLEKIIVRSSRGIYVSSAMGLSILNSAFISMSVATPVIDVYSGLASSVGLIQNCIFESASASSQSVFNRPASAINLVYCGFFSGVVAAYCDSPNSKIYLNACYIDSSYTYGAYGYNITLTDCTNNAATPVYNLTSGGSIEEWDGQALPSIDDATGGQVLALKSDKSALEFATVDVDTLGAASSTTATQSIYVDKAATGAGTGVDWTNAFTTIQAAVDSLPAIINHPMTIYVRKGSTPYRETVTVQRVIAAGSVTIRGEYYWNAEAASNSTANRLVKNAADDFTNIEVGDRVALLQYSGAYCTTYPSGGFYGTVTDVANKASGYITISMDSSVTPTTGWRYIITKTAIDGSDNGSTPVRDYCIDVRSPCTVIGFTLLYPANTALLSNSLLAGAVTFDTLNMVIGSKTALIAMGSVAAQTNLYNFGIVGNTDRTRLTIKASSGGFTATCGFVASMSYSTSVGGIWLGMRGVSSLSYVLWRSLAVDDGIAIWVTSNSYSELQRVSIYGKDASNKLAKGIVAQYGSGVVNNAGYIDITTVTTALTPANWAATTDGSCIQ